MHTRKCIPVHLHVHNVYVFGYVLALFCSSTTSTGCLVCRFFNRFVSVQHDRPYKSNSFPFNRRNQALQPFFFHPFRFQILGLVVIFLSEDQQGSSNIQITFILRLLVFFFLLCPLMAGILQLLRFTTTIPYHRMVQNALLVLTGGIDTGYPPPLSPHSFLSVVGIYIPIGSEPHFIPSRLINSPPSPASQWGKCARGMSPHSMDFYVPIIRIMKFTLRKRWRITSRSAGY